MADFKPGDVVTLKSDHMKMTIASISPDGIAKCIWHDKNKKKTEDYPVIVLKKYVNPAGVITLRNRR